MHKPENLFQAFEPMSKAAWKTRVLQELKGKTYEEVLSRKTDEGFSLDAIYTKSDLDQITWLKPFEPYLSAPVGTPPENRQWQNCTPIAATEVAEAKKHGLEALQNGATALSFTLAESPDFDALFAEILPPHCGIYFDGNTNFLANLEGYFAHIATKKYDFPAITGGYFIAEDKPEILAKAIRRTQKSPAFKSVAIAGTQEKICPRIANMLFALKNKLEALIQEKISPQIVFKKLYFRIEIHNNYFFEIAGLRALRILLMQMAKLYQVDMPGYAFLIHARTSLSAAETDPNRFMLSNTTQAMSAILGGADVLTVQPHTTPKSPNDPFGLRIARNISNLLKEEAYFDKVANPVSGSYYLEILTAKIAEKSWELFQQKVS